MKFIVCDIILDMKNSFASVIVDTSNSSVDKFFDYIIPDNVEVQVGCRVIVEFGKNKIQGFVMQVKSDSDCPISKLKTILQVIDSEPVIIPEMIDLLERMKLVYNLRTIDILRLFLPSEIREGKVKPVVNKFCVLNENVDLELFSQSIRKNSKNQFDLFNYMKEKKIENKIELCKKFSRGAVSKFIEYNVLIVEEIKGNREPLSQKIDNQERELTNLQTNAFNVIQNSTKPVLLHGVTGSGKTEVYLRIIENTISCDKTAIMLVPEISLTPQMYGIFKSRFGDNVAVLHSGLSAGERFDEWQRLFDGKAKIALGARSAIFAPLKNLGIIIIDEEHDDSYTSDSNPRYCTHTVAKMRRSYSDCKIVFGSATPDIETYNRAIDGEYCLVEMPIRINKKQMPNIQIVDMLGEIRQGNTGIFSNVLINEMKNAINNNKQVILFCNRRGYTSFMRCGDCGYIAKCESCDISLVYHKFEEKLKCHYCGKCYKALTVCPNCKSSSIRQGAVGTQKVVDVLKNLFPDVKVLRMDHDTTLNKNAYLKILSDFAKTTPAIMVGTQMIAKGHDFKDVTLVGIVDADQSLYQSNYKSVEKTFQLITQVSGRAGRDITAGKVVLQTYSPRHYVYKFSANYDYKGFFKKEINIREVTKFPPFSRINRILICGKNEETVKQATKMCYNEIIKLKENYKDDVYYLEAMKSPLGKIKNSFRYQIVIRYSNLKKTPIRMEIFNACKLINNGNVSVFIEIAPQNLN